MLHRIVCWNDDANSTAGCSGDRNVFAGENGVGGCLDWRAGGLDWEGLDWGRRELVAVWNGLTRSWDSGGEEIIEGDVRRESGLGRGGGGGGGGGGGLDGAREKG